PADRRIGDGQYALVVIEDATAQIVSVVAADRAPAEDNDAAVVMDAATVAVEGAVAADAAIQHRQRGDLKKRKIGDASAVSGSIPGDGGPQHGERVPVGDGPPVKHATTLQDHGIDQHQAPAIVDGSSEGQTSQVASRGIARHRSVLEGDALYLDHLVAYLKHTAEEVAIDDRVCCGGSVQG